MQPDARAGVYEKLVGLAKNILRAGHNVIVDASFLDRAERDRFRDLARCAGTEFVIVSTSAAREELRRRIERRQRISGDSSEADLAVLRYQFDHADALDADERDCAIEVATDGTVDIDRVLKSID